MYWNIQTSYVWFVLKNVYTWITFWLRALWKSWKLEVVTEKESFRQRLRSLSEITKPKLNMYMCILSIYTRTARHRCTHGYMILMYTSNKNKFNTPHLTDRYVTNKNIINNEIPALQKLQCTCVHTRKLCTFIHPLCVCTSRLVHAHLILATVQNTTPVWSRHSNAYSGMNETMVNLAVSQTHKKIWFRFKTIKVNWSSNNFTSCSTLTAGEDASSLSNLSTRFLLILPWAPAAI